MSYVSSAQQKYFNAQRGKEIPASVVDEFNKESVGLKLPKKVKKSNTGFIIEKSDNPEQKQSPHFRTSKTGKVFQAGRGTKKDNKVTSKDISDKIKEIKEADEKKSSYATKVVSPTKIRVLQNGLKITSSEFGTKDFSYTDKTVFYQNPDDASEIEIANDKTIVTVGKKPDVETNAYGISRVLPQELDYKIKLNDKGTKDFRINELINAGGEAFGTIDKNIATIVGIRSISRRFNDLDEEITKKFKGRGFFEAVIKKLSQKNVNSIRVNLQSEDTRAVLKKLVDKGVLSNPREMRGVSVDEYPTLFDISDMKIKKSKNNIKVDKVKIPNPIDLGYIPYVRPHLFLETNKNSL